MDETIQPGEATLPTGTLTFLFTDIERSTQLWEQHPQAMPAALARHDAIVRTAIQDYRGVVFKTVGDGVHAVFAQAADALAAAQAAQRALHAEAWGAIGPLRVRVALHTGAAELRDSDYFGPPLNRLARILALGHGGQILLSQATHDLVADELLDHMTLRALGAFTLKDISRPERIFQLVSPDLPADFPPLRAGDQSLATPQALQLLTTKLYVPPARAQLIARPRLLTRLDAGLGGKLILLSAPAGFGKTSLVAEWLGRRLEAGDRRLAESPPASSLRPLAPSVAWVSLDAADSDPLRFWSYVIAALDMLQPGSGTAAMALLQSPQPPPTEVVLTPLLNALSALAADAVLVLDDYHLVEAPAIHAALAFVIEHLTPRLHLLITTRADPPLPLTRLRARGELTELRAADLRFTAEEATAFLTELMGLRLSAEDVAALEARTEGWIAGLQLAALAMRDRTDLPGFIAAFSGSNRFVVSYLLEEVLSRQPAHLQTFLTQTAILDRMCGPLCDAVLGLTPDERPMTKDARHAEASKNSVNLGQQLSSFVLGPSSDSYSQLILDQLERANLFLIPLDDERRWYRYHHLFGEVLRARLSSGARASEIVGLHGRASMWFERQELWPEAIQHALAAQDWERAARLIEHSAWPIVYRGQIRTVLGWLSRLPATTFDARPGLCVLHAQMLMHTNQLDAAEARLQVAEQGVLPDTPEEIARTVHGRVLTTRANIRFYRGDLPQSVALGQHALELLPETSSFVRAADLAFAAQAFLVTGDVTATVERQVAAVAPAAQAAGNRFVQLRGYTMLAELHVLQGRLQAAALTYREAAQLAPEHGALQSMVGSAAYYFGLGDLCRELNELTAAEQLLIEGMDRAIGAATPNALYLGQGSIALARLHYARGDHVGARAALQRLDDLGRRHGFDALVLGRGLAMQARLALAQSDLEAAQRWAASSGLRADDEPSFPREMEHLTLARILIEQGRGQPNAPFLGLASALLERLLATAEAGARMRSVIEISALRALALKAQGDADGALIAIARALRLAAPEGYLHTFVDEGAPIAALLVQVARRESPVAAYAATLLAAFPERLEAGGWRVAGETQVSSLQSPASKHVEPLSPREVEILHLIAAGHSNQAIADTLMIAVSTVKRHINTIYGKLAVQSRTQALLRARELQLLE
jgi:LuxR family maltose regulon positive regulatory protein